MRFLFVLLKYYLCIGNQAKWLLSFDFLFFYTSPVTKYFFAFYIPLDIVGKIAEEVNTSLCFQILDAHGVIR